jgi:hypothetical protein
VAGDGTDTTGAEGGAADESEGPGAGEPAGEEPVEAPTEEAPPTSAVTGAAGD